MNNFLQNSLQTNYPTPNVPLKNRHTLLCEIFAKKEHCREYTKPSEPNPKIFEWTTISGLPQTQEVTKTTFFSTMKKLLKQYEIQFSEFPDADHINFCKIILIYSSLFDDVGTFCNLS